MFGWFRPRPPVETPEKLWVEQRMSWLVQTFGMQRLRSAPVVLPTPEFFPDPYAGAEAEARSLFGRVCGYMGVDPRRVDLAFFDRGQPGLPEDAAGLFVAGEREQILIERSQLGDPTSLVGTMAHELAHVLLLGDGLLSTADPDHEYVTDLLTVFLGLGVFGANSVIRESYERFTRWYTWSIGKQGYLSERMYGYAFALFAWVRGEAQPDWAGYLRPNVRAVFRKGLRYLLRTGDSQFREQEEREDQGDEEGQVARRVAALQAPSSGARLAALWDLRGLGDKATPAVPALARALEDSDPFVQAEAAELLAGLGPAAGPAVPALLRAALQDHNESLHLNAVRALGRAGRGHKEVVLTLLHVLGSPEPLLRAQAAEALGDLGPEAAPAVGQLAGLLGDADEAVACAAATALGGIGGAAGAAVPSLLEALRAGEGALPARAAHALGQVGAAGEDVITALKRALRHPDEEAREEAVRALERLVPGGSQQSQSGRREPRRPRDEGRR